MENNIKREYMTIARKSKGLTQTQLGSIVGVSGNAITQYEKGIRFPKPDVLKKICEALNIEVSLFYTK